MLSAEGERASGGALQHGCERPACRAEEVRGAQRRDACGGRKGGLDPGGLRGPEAPRGERSEEIAGAVAKGDRTPGWDTVHGSDSQDQSARKGDLGAGRYSSCASQ